MEVKGVKERGDAWAGEWQHVKGDVKSFGLFQEDAQVWNKWRKKIKGATS